MPKVETKFRRDQGMHMHFARHGFSRGGFNTLQIAARQPAPPFSQ